MARIFVDAFTIQNREVEGHVPISKELTDTTTILLMDTRQGRDDSTPLESSNQFDFCL